MFDPVLLEGEDVNAMHVYRLAALARKVEVPLCMRATPTMTAAAPETMVRRLDSSNPFINDRICFVRIPGQTASSNLE